MTLIMLYILDKGYSSRLCYDYAKTPRIEIPNGQFISQVAIDRGHPKYENDSFTCNIHVDYPLHSSINLAPESDDEIQRSRDLNIHWNVNQKQQADELTSDKTKESKHYCKNEKSVLSNIRLNHRSDAESKKAGAIERDSDFYFPKLTVNGGSTLSIDLTDSVEKLRDAHTAVDDTINALNLMMATSFDDVDCVDGYTSTLASPHLDEPDDYTALVMTSQPNSATSQQSIVSLPQLESPPSLQLSTASLNSAGKQSSGDMQPKSTTRPTDRKSVV